MSAGTSILGCPTPNRAVPAQIRPWSGVFKSTQQLPGRICEKIGQHVGPASTNFWRRWQVSPNSGENLPASTESTRACVSESFLSNAAYCTTRNVQRRAQRCAFPGHRTEFSFVPIRIAPTCSGGGAGRPALPRRHLGTYGGFGRTRACFDQHPSHFDQDEMVASEPSLWGRLFLDQSWRVVSTDVEQNVKVA